MKMKNKLAYLFIIFFVKTYLNGVPSEVMERVNNIHNSFLNLKENLTLETVAQVKNSILKFFEEFGAFQFNNTYQGASPKESLSECLKILRLKNILAILEEIQIVLENPSDEETILYLKNIAFINKDYAPVIKNVLRHSSKSKPLAKE